VEQVRSKLPIKVKKRKPINLAEQGSLAAAKEGVVVDEGEDVVMTGWEEYYDYVFPDDQATGKGKSARNMKLLEMARKWKIKEEGQGVDDSANP